MHVDHSLRAHDGLPLQRLTYLRPTAGDLCCACVRAHTRARTLVHARARTACCGHVIGHFASPTPSPMPTPCERPCPYPCLRHGLCLLVQVITAPGSTTAVLHDEQIVTCTDIHFDCHFREVLVHASNHFFTRACPCTCLYSYMPSRMSNTCPTHV